MIFEEKLLRTFTMPLSLLKVLSFSKKISFSIKFFNGDSFLGKHSFYCF